MRWASQISSCCTAGSTTAGAFLYPLDLLELDGVDLRPFPLERRKDQLRKLLLGCMTGIHFSEHLEDSGAAVFAARRYVEPHGPDAKAIISEVLKALHELLFALQEAMTALQKDLGVIGRYLAGSVHGHAGNRGLANALTQNAGLVVRRNASFREAAHRGLSSLAATRRAASARQRPTTAASETISRSAACCTKSRRFCGRSSSNRSDLDRHTPQVDLPAVGAVHSAKDDRS
jgi:hypothetical protein